MHGLYSDPVISHLNASDERKPHRHGAKLVDFYTDVFLNTAAEMLTVSTPRSQTELAFHFPFYFPLHFPLTNICVSILSRATQNFQDASIHP